jgi:hypothetical protein
MTIVAQRMKQIRRFALRAEVAREQLVEPRLPIPDEPCEEVGDRVVAVALRDREDLLRDALGFRLQPELSVAAALDPVCDENVEPNRYPHKDVLVGGKRFDALQVGVRVLWEIKTDQFDTYTDFLKLQVVRDQVPKMREERDIAAAYGYGFVVGVSTEEHKAALEFEARDLEIVVTGCKR